jgi:hypothetical protein
MSEATRQRQYSHSVASFFLNKKKRALARSLMVRL